MRSRSDLISPTFSKANALRLRPEPAYVRDEEFLRDVGEAAAASDVPVLFSGSVLGHARFILESAGALVLLDHEREGTPQGSPVLARTAAGLTRLIYLPEPLAREALGSLEIAGGPGTDTEALSKRAVAAGKTHASFPRVPYVGLVPGRWFADVPGQPGHFMHHE